MALNSLPANERNMNFKEFKQTRAKILAKL